MNTVLTHIVVLLDESGSMRSIYNDTLAGLNSFIEKQQKVGNFVKFSLYTFDHEFRVRLAGVPISTVSGIDESMWQPRGSTALYDAIFYAISDTQTHHLESPEELRPTSTIVVIVTDGEENASRLYNSQKVKSLIEEKTSEGWEFVYLGANQDAILTAKALGVDRGRAMTYSGTSVGTRSAYESVGANVLSRTAGRLLAAGSLEPEFLRALVPSGAAAALEFSEEQRNSAVK